MRWHCWSLEIEVNGGENMKRRGQRRTMATTLFVFMAHGGKKPQRQNINICRCDAISAKSGLELAGPKLGKNKAQYGIFKF